MLAVLIVHVAQCYCLCKLEFILFHSLVLLLVCLVLIIIS